MRTMFSRSILVGSLLALGCGHPAAEPATETTVQSDSSGSETAVPASEPTSSIGHVFFEAVTVSAPQVSSQEVDAFLSSNEAATGANGCVEHFGEMFESGAGVMEFQIGNDGTAGRMEAPPLDTFGGALAGCVFSEVIEPHHFTPWEPPSGVQVSVRVRFERAAH